MKPHIEQEKIDTSPTFLSSSPVKNENLTCSYSFMNTEYPVLHGHSDYCEILFVYRGTINNYVNGQWKKMTAGDCCLIQKGDVHRLWYILDDADNEFLGINFLIRDDYFEKLKFLCNQDVAEEVFQNTEEQKCFRVTEQEAHSIYKKALASQSLTSDDIQKFEITSKLLTVKLIHRYIEQYYNVEEKSFPSWLLQLLADIQNPANMSKSLADYIRDIPYSYSYIAKEFKKYMDCSMINHITAVKLNHAVELLENTTMSSLEICARIGYNSLSHYNYTFKKFFGRTPSYYRKHKGQGERKAGAMPRGSVQLHAMYQNEKYDIIVVAGQSNAAGTGIGETDSPYVPTENVMMLVDESKPHFGYNEAGEWTLLMDVNTPLHIEIGDERYGQDGDKLGQFQLSFGKQYYEKYLQDTDRKVLIVQAAVGGTCFARKEWGTEGTILFDRLVKMTRHALSLNSENRLAAFLWHQGESDTVEIPERMPQQRYDIHKKDLTELFQTFCHIFACPEIPIIAGSFVNEWYQKNKEAADKIYAAIKEVIADRNGVFVDASELKSNNEQTGNGDDIHFSRDALQKLGKLYFEAFAERTSQK